jgi:hypothetical protein
VRRLLLRAKRLVANQGGKVRGKPKKLEYGTAVEVAVQTELKAYAKQSVYFKRGVIGSQAYAREFHNVDPRKTEGRRTAAGICLALSGPLRGHAYSMAREIPDGAYCLFGQTRSGSRQGRKLLVWHSGISDPHTGGQYTLKVYTSEKASDGDGWQNTRVILKPLNPKYEPIVLTPGDEGEVRTVAEFVEVVR